MTPEDERAVTSEPVTTEEGEEVVVQQQNVGPGNQIGGGEFKNVERGKSPEEVAQEQRELAAEAPTEVDALEAARSLHSRLLTAWNDKDTAGYRELFATNGTLVGFDGSTVEGREEIAAHIGGVFADHEPAAYVAVVRDVRQLGSDVVLLRAVAGMVLPGQQDIAPELNAIQTLLAVNGEAGWRIELFQNTPAAFHGRLDAVAALTAELAAAREPP